MIFKQTPNISGYTTKKVGYILHGTLGSYAGAINWLCTRPQDRPILSYSSAHYVISKKGEVTQLATHDQVTWHAGIIHSPTWRARKYLPTKSGVPFVVPFKNPNDSFVGIEFEWFQGDKITEAQLGTVVNIIKTGGINNPIVLSHSELTSYKADFGRDEIGMYPVQEVLRRIK